MATGIGVVFYYAFQDLPHPSERNYVTPHIQSLPLFFGTAIFAFEVISLVSVLHVTFRHPATVKVTLTFFRYFHYKIL